MKTLKKLLCGKDNYLVVEMKIVGKSKAELRRQIMIELTGKRLPLAGCGVTVIWNELCKKFNVSKGSCLVNQWTLMGKAINKTED